MASIGAIGPIRKPGSAFREIEESLLAYKVTSNLKCPDTPGHLMGDIYDNLSKIGYVD